MASLIYNSCLYDMTVGAIDFDTDTFYVMLVTSLYAPNKDGHSKRSDVTNEVSGTGYTSGGQSSAVTVVQDNTLDRVNVVFADVSWPSSTITAKGAVIYKRRGGASSLDELVAYVDFGSDVTSTNGTYAVSFSSPMSIQN